MRAYLDLPDSTCPIAPGPVQLRAMVDLHGHDEPGPHDLRWRSNLEGDLGTGAELLATLGPGTHEITFSAPDGLGSTFAERGIIIVSG
jgi:hypothetical protein